MKKLLSICLFLIGFPSFLQAQEFFVIKDFQTKIRVNQDASLKVYEKIWVNFRAPRHGIYRNIPFRYPLESLPIESRTTLNQLTKKNFRNIIIDNIRVKDWDFEVGREGNEQFIRIGDEDEFVSGDQVYEITYRVRNAINFYVDHSQLYWDVIGTQWQVPIEEASFHVEFYKDLRDTSDYFVFSGSQGAHKKTATGHWTDRNTFEGHLLEPLKPNEGITFGMSMPKRYLQQPDLRFLGWGWVFLPVLVFVAMINLWRRKGKDLPLTVTTQYYPPENLSPSVAGYIINSRLDHRDLTVLIPYWGAAGYLKVNELIDKKLFGLIKDTDYEFVKLKALPEAALTFERNMFDGLFKDGDTVKLSDLKNKFYVTMNKSKKALEKEIDKEAFYVKHTRAMAILLPIMGVIVFVIGLAHYLIYSPVFWIPGLSGAATGIILFLYGIFMEKKTKKGTELYARLLGFKEFIKSVEKDRLNEFLKQDANYFDKILPYAIVFDMADVWKDKLEGLEVSAPKWYSGSYAGARFHAPLFLSNLDKSMKSISSGFYSGSSGSSSSGGGFGGGGFGGGGGGSW